jgi:hypothetical protein
MARLIGRGKICLSRFTDLIYWYIRKTLVVGTIEIVFLRDLDRRG